MMYKEINQIYNIHLKTKIIQFKPVSNKKAFHIIIIYHSSSFLPTLSFSSGKKLHFQEIIMSYLY